MTTIRFTFLLTLLFLMACRTTQYTHPADYPNASISFGSGGGFSGMVTEFSLLDNGQLLKKLATQDSFEMLKTIDRKLAKQIFDNYTFLNINQIDHQQPGNLYRFIKYHSGETQNEIVWAPGNAPTDNLTLFNNILMGITKPE